MGFESMISPLHLTREEVPIKIELIGNTANVQERMSLVQK